MSEQDKRIRATLSQLEEVPGGGLDKEQAWSKLQQRMSAQPVAHKKRGAYYAAAAAIILALLCIAMLWKQPDKEISLATTPPTPAPVKTDKPHTATATQPTNAVQQQPVVAAKHSTQQKPETIPIPIPKHTEPVPTVIAPEKPAPETTLTETNMVAEARPMKVFHINELSEARMPPEAAIMPTAAMVAQQRHKAYMQDNGSGASTHSIFKIRP